MNRDDLPWSWEVAGDPDEVHALICACDAFTATARAPAPVRSPESTRRRVDERAVHLLRHGPRAVATFTLTPYPPFDADLSLFPPARRPAYLGRLAVMPERLATGELLGPRCLRRAVELAAAAGCDALRSEANPDLEGVRAMLHLFGFQEYGQAQAQDGRRRVYLQKTLAGGAP
ncbi:MAG TPA: hypothetical protein VFR37_00425 [Longimicrobium sp.]|nr:hypothetical protein [Longimicrobium sp.]